MPLARAAYHKLFEVLEIQDDYGRGVGAADLHDVDINEARARYLRALYETESPADRPSALFEEMRRLGARFMWPGRPKLEDVIRVAAHPLPERRIFLRAWIALLRERIDHP